jgi:hypothetical protein
VNLILRTCLSVLFFGLLQADRAVAQAASVPLPEPAPREEVNSGVDTTPVPKPRPKVEAEKGEEDEPVKEDAEERSLGGDKPADGAEAVTDDPDVREEAAEPPEAVDSACVAELVRAGAVFTALDEIEGEGRCGIAHPFRISGFSGGIALKPAADLDCATALALAQWVETELRPAARVAVATLTDEEKPERKSVTAIRQASSYVCRSRNSQKGAKLSEHGKGRAIDIAGFTLADGTAVPVTPREDDHTTAGALQAAVRKGACLHFTTVLGPGADSFHADHIHLDLAQRGGGYRICQ